ncbi:MAG: hypothetical protein HYY13_08300 [Nitrospirae bacterium]|nr:hypothetical protein [Nitrospirota bacterium]
MLLIASLVACEATRGTDADVPAGPAWTREYQIFVYGQPPLSYLKAVSGTGIAWSVFHGGVNDAQLAYTRELQAEGIRVASNFPTMQGSPTVMAADPAASDPDFLRRTATQDLAGEPALAMWLQPEPPYLPSHNDPEWQDFLKRRAAEHARGGVDALHIDEVEGVGGHLYLFGFDPDSIVAFRSHMKGLFSAARLRDTFGITDIDSFDYRAYLNGAGARSLGDDPNADLRREFVRFQLLSRRAQLADLIRHTREVAGREVGFAGNAVNLGPQYQVQATVLDFLVYEVMLPLPPQGRLVALHRLGYHLLRKGVTAAFPNIINLRDMVESGRDWSTIAMRFAEAWAAQQSFLLPHNAYVFGGGLTTVTGPATVPEDVIGPMAAFAWGRRDLREARWLAKVGLVYSFKTSLDEFLDMGYALSYTTTGHHNAFLSAGEQLQSEHIPFDVVYAGDEAVIPRRLRAADLDRFEVLVVPPGTTFAEEDRAALDEFERVGGRIVSTLSASDAGGWAVLGDLPSTITVTMAEPSSGDLVAHFVNYDYDRDAGQFRTTPASAISLPLPEGHTGCPDAQFKTPDGESRIIAARVASGRLEISLPPFSVYGLLICTKGA